MQEQLKQIETELIEAMTKSNTDFVEVSYKTVLNIINSLHELKVSKRNNNTDDGTRSKQFKRCTGCKKLLPVSMFGKNSTTPDGYRYYCKECTKKQNKKYREKIKQKNAEREI